MENKRRTYVLDTSALIADPDIFYKLGESDIIVPVPVIKELDGLKKSGDLLVAKAARKVSRELDLKGSYGDIANGVKLSTGAIMKVCKDYRPIDGLESPNDNRIVGAALKIMEETDNRVKILTTDCNMRNVARSYGIKAENYPFYLGEEYSRPKRRYFENETPSVEYAEKAGKIGDVAKVSNWKSYQKEAIIALIIFIILYLLASMR